MLSGLRRSAPYIALFAEVLVFYRRVLLSARYVVPWDFTGYHFPLAAFIAKSFRHGQLPLWDPYTYCGFPFYANIQAQLFYPPAVATIFLSNFFGPTSLLRMLEWMAALHVFLGGVFTYLLVRRLGAGRAAATLGGTVYQLGGFFTSQAQHLGAFCGAAWLPLGWLSVVVLAGGFTWRWAAVLALSLSMSFLAGFPAMTVVVFVSSLMLGIVLIGFKRAHLTLLGAYGLACLWSFLLAGIQLLPTWELAKLSTAPQRGQWGGGGGGVPLQALVSLVWPNYYSIFDLSHYKLPWNPTFLYLYCSLGGLILALAVVFLRKGKFWAIFALVTLLSALWMLGEYTPVGKIFYVSLPLTLRSPIYAEFAMASFVLGMAVLAGLGAEAFVTPRGTVFSVLLTAVVAFDLVHAGSGKVFNCSPVSSNRMVTAESFEGSRDSLIKIRSLVNQSVPPARIEPVEDSENWAVAASLTEVPTASGDDPLALVRILKVRLLFAKGEPWNRYYVASRLDSPVFKLLNVRYVVSLAPSEPAEIRRASFTQVAQVRERRFYENHRALPRFFLVRRLRRVANMEEGLRLMASPEFDPLQAAVVEGNLDYEGSGGLAHLKPVKIIAYAPSEVQVETEAAEPAFLVTSETFYPGWKASIDGRQAPLFLTNVAFRGMPVPAGRHRIAMRYEPRTLRLGMMVSLIGWVALALGLRIRRPAPK